MYFGKLCNLLKEKRQIKPVKRKTMRVLTTTPQFDDKGRAVKGSNFVTYDVVNNLMNLRVDDFSITSLQAVGADLKMTQLSMDPHTLLGDLTNKTADFISKNVQSNNNE